MSSHLSGETSTRADGSKFIFRQPCCTTPGATMHCACNGLMSIAVPDIVNVTEEPADMTATTLVPPECTNSVHGRPSATDAGGKVWVDAGSLTNSGSKALLSGSHTLPSGGPWKGPPLGRIYEQLRNALEPDSVRPSASNKSAL